MDTKIYDMNIDAIFFDDSDNEYHACGDIIAGMRGLRDRYGRQETPDDEDEIVLLNVTNKDGLEIDLTDDLECDALNALWDAYTTQ